MNSLLAKGIIVFDIDIEQRTSGLRLNGLKNVSKSVVVVANKTVSSWKINANHWNIVFQRRFSRICVIQQPKKRKKTYLSSCASSDFFMDTINRSKITALVLMTVTIRRLWFQDPVIFKFSSYLLYK